MRTLALRYVLGDVPRLIASLAGIAFVVALVLVQAGIYSAFVGSTTLLIDESDAQLWVASRDMQYLEITLPLAYDAVRKIRKIEGVAHAEPLAIRSAIRQSPSGLLDYVRVVGFEPVDSSLRLGVPAATLASMKIGDFAADAAQLGALDARGIGATGTIRNVKARVAALTHGTQPIVSPTFLYATMDSAVAWSPLSLGEIMGGAPSSDSPINYVLVRLRSPADAPAVSAAIERAVPGTRAFPRDEMAAITRAFWVRRTNIGFLLALGAIIGALGGGVVVAQILYISVNEHLREYALLRAVGIPNRALYGAIVWQAVALAVLGYVPGVVVSLVVVAIARAARNLDLTATPGDALLALGVALLICLVAGLLAVRRAVRVDPALVFDA
ncbi:MAG TPA: FtsX-like permease family protein [Candidatus Elarobacter sp.]|nr:FtsX-like permease family protein [Candidatus Elarobacter sp.]